MTADLELPEAVSRARRAGQVRMEVWLPEDDYAALTVRLQERGMSRTAWLRALVKDELTDIESPPEPAPA